MSILIRRMTLEDVDQVHNLEQQVFKDCWPRRSFVYEVENEDYSHPFVMLQQEKIVGYAVVWYVSRELHINNIAVAPEFRRQGFGAKLLEYILDLFQDFDTAFLEVRISNTAAISLYEKYMFIKAAIRKKYYTDGEDALIMVCNKAEIF